MLFIVGDNLDNKEGEQIVFDEIFLTFQMMRSYVRLMGNSALTYSSFLEIVDTLGWHSWNYWSFTVGL